VLEGTGERERRAALRAAVTAAGRTGSGEGATCARSVSGLGGGSMVMVGSGGKIASRSSSARFHVVSGAGTGDPHPTSAQSGLVTARAALMSGVFHRMNSSMRLSARLRSIWSGEAVKRGEPRTATAEEGVGDEAATTLVISASGADILMQGLSYRQPVQHISFDLMSRFANSNQVHINMNQNVIARMPVGLVGL
jgi:hypothetical protein